nr:MAG TPA: MCC J25-L, LINEAR FORM OF PEPTIDE [Caudoviricetes sp.]
MNSHPKFWQRTPISYYGGKQEVRVAPEGNIYASKQ